jgi:hypothetical protein
MWKLVEAKMSQWRFVEMLAEVDLRVSVAEVDEVL